MTPKVLWEIVKKAAEAAGIDKLAPHDLRRTCARLCHLAGGELDQIQFLLGHVSIQTTEHYLGCKQKLRVAVNDKSESNRDAKGRITRPFWTMQDYDRAVAGALGSANLATCTKAMMPKAAKTTACTT